MPKSDPIENALNRLGELRRTETSASVLQELRACLGNRSNLVVAKAAKVTAELQGRELVPELVAAFDRFMANPQQLDKRCAAVTEITGALYQFDYLELEVYLRGLRHVQKEASFGPPIDTAAALRGISAQGLARSRYRDALPAIVPLLVDPEPPARIGAIRALATNGGESGVLLLQLKVLTGDRDPEVLGECFSGLLTAAPEKSLKFVARYVDDEDDALAEAAIWALGESRLPAAFQVLREKWERTVSRPERKVLLAALAACRLQESIDFLRALVENGSRQTAADTLEALAIYRGNETVIRSIASAVRNREDNEALESFNATFGAIEQFN